MADGDSAAQGDLLADKGDAAAAATGDKAPAADAAKASDAKAAASDDKAATAGDVKAEPAKELAKDGDKAADADKAKDAAKEGDAVDYAKALAEAVPEGMKLDDAAAKPYIEAFAKHKITPDAVKELVALQAASNKAATDGQAKAFADAVAGWKKESTADKDLGAENLGLAKTTAGKVFDAKTIELMEHFGLMNHPGVLKGLVKIGKATKDDSRVPGDAGSRGDGADARKQFPNSNMNP